MQLCRNPDSKERPQFAHIVQNLNVPASLLVTKRDIDEGDVCEPGTMAIGTPLQAAKNLYIKLQHTYLHNM